MKEFKKGDLVEFKVVGDIHQSSVFCCFPNDRYSLEGWISCFSASQLTLVDEEQSLPNGFGETAANPVNNPLHYCTAGEIECIDAIQASMTPEAFKGFLKGNVQKYMWRYEKKLNPTEDLKKARWYLDKLIEIEGAKS